jgi:hypothetical protein
MCLRGQSWMTATVLTLALAGCGSPQRPHVLRRPPPSVARPLLTAKPRRSSLAPAATLSRGNNEPRARRSQLGGALPVARAFFRAYVHYLYGHLPPARVPDVDHELRQELDHWRVLTTPAERAARPRLLGVKVVAAGPPVSAIAIATIQATAAPVPLTATLERRGAHWLVVALDG